MSRVWRGGIYLKDEGGYELVFRALSHYKKRLRAIERAPELNDAPMFAQIIKQEAVKTATIIDQVIDKIKKGLQNAEALNELQDSIPLFEKALNCYQSDIQKAKNADKFYSEFISDMKIAESDVTNIKITLAKLSTFV